MFIIALQVNSNILQFADDSKMFRVVHDGADFYQLQEDIDKLVACMGTKVAIEI